MTRKRIKKSESKSQNFTKNHHNRAKIEKIYPSQQQSQTLAGNPEVGNSVAGEPNRPKHKKDSKFRTTSLFLEFSRRKNAEKDEPERDAKFSEKKRDKKKKERIMTELRKLVPKKLPFSYPHSQFSRSNRSKRQRENKN